MCWVMPPASPATTLALRIWSSSLVLPWSTWPMTVMTGARERRVVVVLEEVEVEQLLQLDLLLLAGVDQADLGAELGGEQLDHVVGQRLGGRDHLALLHQEADDVGRGAVELGTELLGGGGALDHDLARGDRGVVRRVARRRHRLQLVAVATATPCAGAPVGDHRDRLRGDRRDVHHRVHLHHRDRPGPPPMGRLGPPDGPGARTAPAPTGPRRARRRPAGDATGVLGAGAAKLARRRRDGLARRRHRGTRPGGGGIGPTLAGDAGRGRGGRCRRRCGRGRGRRRCGRAGRGGGPGGRRRAGCDRAPRGAGGAAGARCRWR